MTIAKTAVGGIIGRHLAKMSPAGRLEVILVTQDIVEHIMTVNSILPCTFLSQSFPPRSLVGKRVAQAELAEKVVEMLFRPAGINSQPAMPRIRIRATSACARASITHSDNTRTVNSRCAFDISLLTGMHLLMSCRLRERPGYSASMPMTIPLPGSTVMGWERSSASAGFWTLPMSGTVTFTRAGSRPRACQSTESVTGTASAAQLPRQMRALPACVDTGVDVRGVGLDRAGGVPVAQGPGGLVDAPAVPEGADVRGGLAHIRRRGKEHRAEGVVRAGHRVELVVDAEGQAGQVGHPVALGAVEPEDLTEHELCDVGQVLHVLGEGRGPASLQGFLKLSPEWKGR